MTDGKKGIPVERGGKILVVRVGRGGDLVMITPALRALLAAFPAAEVHLLAGRDGGRILGDFDPRLTRIWSFHRRFPGRLLVQRRLDRQIRTEGYTRIYVFESKPFYRQWLRGAAPALFALAAGTTGHFCDLCLDLVQQSVAAPIDRNWVSLPVSPAGLARARALLDRAGLLGASRLVGLHPTFSGTSLPIFRDRQGVRHRMWPPAHFARLAVLLRQEARRAGAALAVVIDALPQERSYAEAIVRLSGGEIDLLAEAPDFQRYKGLLQCLDALVTPNTGPMHIAAAVGTPLVALFSRWQAAECGPYMDPGRYRLLAAEAAAEPRRGLAAIQPEAVAEAVWSLLQTTRAPAGGIGPQAPAEPQT